MCEDEPGRQLGDDEIRWKHYGDIWRFRLSFVPRSLNVKKRTHQSINRLKMHSSGNYHDSIVVFC